MYEAKTAGRNAVQFAPETTRQGEIGETLAANFVQLTWRPAYGCRNAVIDDQHRNLFERTNQLLAALLAARPADEVTVLIDDVAGHFNDEEAIIAAAGFPEAAQYAAIHRDLVASAFDLVDRFHVGPLVIGDLFQFLAHDVIARHMWGADREFFVYLQGKN